MNDVFENYKKEFIKENCYFTKTVSNEEYLRLDEEERKEYSLSSGINDAYYKTIPYDFKNEEDLKLYITMQDSIKKEGMDKNINTIKNIIVFWFILTIINIIATIHTAVKINQLFK